MLIDWPESQPPPAVLEIRLLSIPVRAGLAAAHDPTPPPARELTVVRVSDQEGNEGWGECSALTTASYWPETARSSFDALSTVASMAALDPHRLEPMARASIEHALLDLQLRTDGRSLAEHLGVTAPSVAAGYVIGLGSIEHSLSEIAQLVDEGVRRVKLKIQPGHDKAVVAAVHSQWPKLEIHVDANGAYDETDLPALRGLFDTGVSVFEQPFAWATGANGGTSGLGAAAALVAAGAMVLADESITSIASLDRHEEARALTGVVVKPARLGGVTNTLSLLATLAERGLDAAPGGMLESGLGRRLLTSLAGRREFTVIGDVSPAKRWLAVDPWSDITVKDGQAFVPSDSGVAPLPDQELIDELTVKRAILGAFE